MPELYTAEQRAKALDYAFGVVDGFEPTQDEFLPLSMEERKRRRALAVMDENLQIHEPHPDAAFSALTSTFDRNIAPVVGAATAIAGSNAYLAGSGADPVIAGIGGPVGLFAAHVATTLGSAYVGATGGDAYRDMGKTDSQKEVEANQDAYFKEKNPVQHFVGKFAAQALGFKLPSVDLFTGGAKAIAGKGLSFAEEQALKAAPKQIVTGATMGAGLSTGQQTYDKLVNDKPFHIGDIALDAVMGAAAGEPRVIPRAVGRTAGTGLANLQRVTTGEPPVEIRLPTTENTAVVPGTLIAKLDEHDPETAQVLLNREATKRNYMGLRDATLNELATGEKFKQLFPNEDYQAVLKSAADKRLAGYRAGYSPEYKRLKLEYNLTDDLARETRDNIHKSDPADPQYQAWQATLPAIIAQKKQNLADLEAYTKSGAPKYASVTYTPAEAQAIKPFADYFVETRNITRSSNSGTTAGENPNYFPFQINKDALQKIVNLEKPGNRDIVMTQLIDRLTGKEQNNFSENYGKIYNGPKAREHFQGALTELMGRGLDQTGREARQDPHDFSALFRPERNYDPLELVHTNPSKVLELYGSKYAEGQSLSDTVGKSPRAQRSLGFDTDESMKLDQISGEYGKRAKDIITQAKDSSSSKDVVVAMQRFGNSMKMQIPTGVNNYIQGAIKSTRDVIGLKSAGAILRGNVDAFTDYGNLRAEAVRQGNLRTNNDDFQYAQDMALANEVADGAAKFLANATDVSNKVQKYTGSNFLEGLGRVRDFAVGKRLAALAMENPNTQVNKEWLQKYSAGTDPRMPTDELAKRLASNYVVGQQSSYDYTGLPASLAEKPTGVMQEGAQFATRLSRYGIDTTLRMYNDIIKPAERGDARPLIAVALASMAGKPILKGISDTIRATAQPSDSERDKEITLAAPEDMQGVYKALHLMEILEGTQTAGTLGTVLSTVAKRAQGKSYDYAGSPAMFVPNAISDAITSLSKAHAAGANMYDEIMRLMGDNLMHSMQSLQAAANAFQGADERQLREDVRLKSDWERLNDSNNSLDLMIGRAKPFSAFVSPYEPSLHQLEHAYTDDGDIERAGAGLDVKSQNRQLTDALRYKGLEATKGKRAQFEDYVLELKGKDYLDKLNQRAAANQSNVLSRIERGRASLPALQAP